MKNLRQLKEKDSSESEKSNSDVERQEENDSESESDSFNNINDEVKDQSESKQDVPSRSLRNRQQIQPHPKYDDYMSNFFGLFGEVEDINIDAALNNPK